MSLRLLFFFLRLVEYIFVQRVEYVSADEFCAVVCVRSLCVLSLCVRSLCVRSLGEYHQICDCIFPVILFLCEHHQICDCIFLAILFLCEYHQMHNLS